MTKKRWGVFKIPHEFKGFAYAILSSFLVGLGFVFTKLILQDANPETSSLYFFGFGVLSSFLILGVKKELKDSKSFKTHWRPMIVLGFLSGVASLLWFYSIDLIGPSLTAFLIRFLIVFTVLWGVLFFKEKFNKIEILAMIIAVTGIVLLNYVSNNGQFFSLGALAGLGAAFLFSLTQVIIKLYAGRVTPLMLNHWRLTLTFLILLIYTVSLQKLQAPTYPVLIFAFLGGVLGGTIGVYFFYKALEIAEISKVNIIRTIDPFVVVAYSFLIFQEIPTLKQMIGGFLIVAGVVLLTLSRHRPKIISRWIS